MGMRPRVGYGQLAFGSKISATLRLALTAAFSAALLSAADDGARAQDAVPPGENSEIDWEQVRRDAEAQGLDTGDPREGLGFTSFEGVGGDASELRIPVLLPSSLIEAGRLNQLDEPLQLTASVNTYSAEAVDAPRSYLITGTRIVFDGVAPAEGQQTSGELFVEISVYGVEASFERYGAVYSITIFCADPRTDPECTEEDTARRLASEMILAP